MRYELARLGHAVEAAAKTDAAKPKPAANGKGKGKGGGGKALQPPGVGPGKCRSPHHSMPSNSMHNGSTCAL